MMTSVGLQKAADAFLANLGALTLKLYKNDVTPSAASVAGDFTEADFGGYTAKTLAANSWNAATVSSGVATATYAQQTFTANATGAAVYGWFVVNSAGALIAAGRFGSAITIVSGTQIQATPTVPVSQPA